MSFCRYTVLLAFILTLIHIEASFAQQYLFSLRHINIEDGLPARQVSDVAQDNDGFIWISSRLGVHRFDGYSYKTYTNAYLNLPDRNAAHIVIDRQNRLWYSKWKSLGQPVAGVLDLNGDSLVSVIDLPGGKLAIEEIYSVHHLEPYRREMLIITKSGILYNYSTTGWQQICRWPTPVQGVFTALKTRDGNYWVCNGQKAFQVERGQIREVSHLPVRHQAFVNSIFERNGVPIFETDANDKFAYYTIEGSATVPFRIKGGSSEKITKTLHAHPEYTVYAKQDSLIVRDTLGKLLFSAAFPGGPSFIKKPPFIKNTFLDQQSNLWIATRNGLLKLSSKRNPFTIINPGIGVPGILKEGEQLWLSGDSNYLVKDLARGIKLANPLPYPATYFLKDQRGHIMIGTRNGLFDYTPDSLFSAVSQPERFKLLLAGKQIRLLFQNPVTGNYWVAGIRPADNIGEGYIFDLGQGRISRPLLPDSLLGIGVRTRQFVQCPEGIWLVTNSGLFLLDASTETLVKHYSREDGLPFDDLYCLYREASGIFWLGSNGGGLIRWDRKNGHFRQFTTEHGLSNSHLYAVIEDDYGALWLPSDFGLMAFDKRSFTTELYLPQDGLALEEFNFSSYFQDHDGTLYFGGPAGITCFHPSDIHKMKEGPVPLKLTQARVLESEEDTFQDRTPEFLKTGKLQMYPGDEILEIDLALLDFRDPGQNRFAYRIQGYQEQWIHTNSRTISLFGLPYGRYELVVKGRGTSGGWNPVELSIPLHVQAPFYLQTWFIICMIFLAIATVWGGVNLRLRSLKKGQEQLEAEVKKRTRQLEEQNRQIEADKQVIATQAEELKALDKAKTRFFSNITHEFRTPLTLVIGPLEQVISEQPPPTIFRRRLNGVLKNARHLLGLINQMLDLSKIESGRMKTEAARGDLVAYTKELTNRFQPLARKKELRLAFIAHQDNWETQFDKDKWDKIVYNLLSNAIKFTPPGNAIQLSVMKAREEEKEFIRLDVKDTGMGIEKDQLEHIFDRFYQADDSATRAQGGTGIGLALVKELVELQRGRIRVSSEPGKGTSFELFLPVLPANQARPLAENDLAAEPLLVPDLSEEKPALAGKTAPADGQEKLELLIIEDNEEVREYIRYCLDASKYNITEAGDGEEGLEKALALVPDLIISDVMMPKMDGFDVTQAIRNNISTSHIPLILLTARASLESRLTGLQRGADAYLTKPFSPQELALRIEKLIEIRQLLRQRYQNGPPPAGGGAFKQEDEFIVNLREYILEHIDEANLSGDRIGRHFAMSRTHLHRKLKALTDQPITDFVRSVRLRKSLELIREGRLNVSEISYQTGFSSLSHFSRSFKKAYGKSPSEM